MIKRKQPEYLETLELFGQGITQKDIAKKVGVSEPTISKWIKDSPIIQAQKTVKSLLNKLEKEAEVLPADEVCKISDAIIKLYKIAYPNTRTKERIKNVSDETLTV